MRTTFNSNRITATQIYQNAKTLNKAYIKGQARYYKATDREIDLRDLKAAKLAFTFDHFQLVEINKTIANIENQNATDSHLLCTIL